MTAHTQSKLAQGKPLARTTLATIAIAMLTTAAAAQEARPAAPQQQQPAAALAIGAGEPAPALDIPPGSLLDDVLQLGRDRSDRMTMPVQIAGMGPYDFVIDTGSQKTIVASEIAQRLALPSLPPVEIVSMAGRVTVSSVQVGGLSFGDHVVENLEALSIGHNDLGSAGLIGLDGLRDKRLTLDFRARRMTVGRSVRANHHDSVRSDPDTIVVEARSRFGQLILVDSRIDGRRVNVILDTGAEMSVGNMALFRNLRLNRLVVPPTPTTLTSVTGVEVPALFTIVKRISIGSVQLANVPMVFLDAAPFDELGLAERPAMLLGMHMLRQFDRVAIDFGNRRIDFQLPSGASSGSATRFASLQAPRAGGY